MNQERKSLKNKEEYNTINNRHPIRNKTFDASMHSLNVHCHRKCKLLFQGNYFTAQANCTRKPVFFPMPKTKDMTISNKLGSSQHPK